MKVLALWCCLLTVSCSDTSTGPLATELNTAPVLQTPGWFEIKEWKDGKWEGTGLNLNIDVRWRFTGSTFNSETGRHIVSGGYTIELKNDEAPGLVNFNVERLSFRDSLDITIVEEDLPETIEGQIEQGESHTIADDFEFALTSLEVANLIYIVRPFGTAYFPKF
jgi:hypothetical protein|tara:strand:+ start:244 stop:738 length:495 start_codon:yes stop_codon:yes gene_type:complete